MTDAIPNETAMLLGRLGAQIESLTTSIDELSKKSDERGKRTYEELERLRTELATNRHELAALQDRIEKAEPVIKEISAFRLRLSGMQMLLGLQAAAIGGAIALFWNWAGDKLGIH